MTEGRRVPLWLIPTGYLVATVVAGLILPRLERAYLGEYVHGMSAESALAFFSAVSSGMMALTGIVFAIAFVMVQFNAVAYSPRLVAVFGSDPTLFHALGLFFATFGYSLAALVWTDRSHAGTVPLVSTVLVIVLLTTSMLAFTLLVHKLGDLQISNVLHLLGEKGRTVIHTTFRHISDDQDTPQDNGLVAPVDLGPATQSLTYSGRPRVIAQLDHVALVQLAQRAGAVIVIEYAVGDTLIEGSILLRVHRATKLPEAALMRAIHLADARTFDQDPKYAIRLLVDIAIRALSPAVNDPTTAVQALDQIEDLLRRLGHSELDAGRAFDADGVLRLVYPVPAWQDYLALSFDEIRQFGKTSVQVVRRLRAALTGLAKTVLTEHRRSLVQRYLEHLDHTVDLSEFDDQDRITALQEDRQGLGLSRNRPALAEVNKP